MFERGFCTTKWSNFNWVFPKFRSKRKAIFLQKGFFFREKLNSIQVFMFFFFVFFLIIFLSFKLSKKGIFQIFLSSIIRFSSKHFPFIIVITNLLFYAVLYSIFAQFFAGKMIFLLIVECFFFVFFCWRNKNDFATGKILIRRSSIFTALQSLVLLFKKKEEKKL